MADWRAFRGQYARLFQDVDQQYPVFWNELGDLLERHRRQRYTTQGAQVREFPTTRERAIQTEKTWSVDQALYEVFGQNLADTVENASQTEPTQRTIGIKTTPDLRTMEAQTTPDHRMRETQTLPQAQRTVGTQVELTMTTWNCAAGPSGLTDRAGAPKGRGGGLRPIRPSELVPSQPRGFTPPGPLSSLPREAPAPLLARGRTPSRTARRSPSPRRSLRRPTERRARSTRRRSARGSPEERGTHSRSPPGADRKETSDRRIAGRSSSTLVPTRGSTVSWNCRATDHWYMDCLHPRDNPYCYGCGRRGVTMRTCPGCGPEWRNLGPYRPEQGHLGRRDLPFS